ncbi:MAG: hypothetical protein DRH11_13210 [Deltaproteobacteria bacterium]|nr:MAG: hypothetical protein DRH11_13210 [Deltaproteobacteria bacterium]
MEVKAESGRGDKVILSGVLARLGSACAPWAHSNQPKAGKSSRPDQPFKQFLRGKGEEGGNYMANRNRHTFKKSQKELKRKKKAAEKMARRQGKKNLGKEEEKPEAESDQ